MIKIAICDDEKIACSLLAQSVSFIMDAWKENYEIACFLSAAELLQSSHCFDIFLLDIQMPIQDGLELAKKIRETGNQSCIIFVTALEEYVYDAFEVEALDYICKPVDDTRLKKALHRAIRKLKENKDTALFIQTKNWCKSVKLSSIYYCEVINRKLYLHTQSGVITYYSTLEDIEKQLDYRFVRCHRSYFVNLDYLLEYANDQITVENGEKVPVSRLRHQAVMEAMLQYMKRESI